MNIDKMEVVHYYYPDKDTDHYNHFYSSFVPLLRYSQVLPYLCPLQSVLLEVNASLTWN